jgi:hypothetical protein
VRAALEQLLARHASASSVASADDAVAIMAQAPFDAVLAAREMRGHNGLWLLQHVKVTHPNTRRVLVSTSGGETGHGAAERVLVMPIRARDIATMMQSLFGDAPVVRTPLPQKTPSAPEIVSPRVTSPTPSPTLPRVSSVAPRPTPTRTGTLDATPLVALLTESSDGAATSTLELAGPHGASAVFTIRAGLVVKGRVAPSVAHLGRVLYELGHLSLEDLDRSLVEVARSKRLHGEVLLSTGIITREKLAAGLRAQLAAMLRQSFALPSSTMFALYQSVDLLVRWGGDDVAELDPLPLAWSATRESPVTAIVDATLAKNDGALRFTKTADLDRFGLARDERDLLELLRIRPLRFAELATKTLLKPQTVRALVYFMIVTRQLEVAPRTSHPSR